MALISEVRGNKDSSFSKLFGNSDIGFLMSQIQGAMIKSGNDLERFITELIDNDKITTLDEVKRNGRAGVYYLIKVKQPKAGGAHAKIVDFGIVDYDKKRISIVELKLGHNFDTQKAPAIRASLQSVAEYVSALTGFSTAFYLCSFYADNTDMMFIGLKKQIDPSQLLTGRDFCHLMDIDYDKILSMVKVDQIKNMGYLMDKVLNLPAWGSEWNNGL